MTIAHDNRLADIKTALDANLHLGTPISITSSMSASYVKLYCDVNDRVSWITYQRSTKGLPDCFELDILIYSQITLGSGVLLEYPELLIEYTNNKSAGRQKLFYEYYRALLFTYFNPRYQNIQDVLGLRQFNPVMYPWPEIELYGERQLEWIFPEKPDLSQTERMTLERYANSHKPKIIELFDYGYLIWQHLFRQMVGWSVGHSQVYFYNATKFIDLLPDILDAANINGVHPYRALHNVLNYQSELHTSGRVPFGYPDASLNDCRQTEDNLDYQISEKIFNPLNARDSSKLYLDSDIYKAT